MSIAFTVHTIKKWENISDNRQAKRTAERSQRKPVNGNRQRTDETAQHPGGRNLRQIKQDQEYDRLWRRKETMVKLELLLVSIGHNLRTYHTHKMQKQKQQKN